MTEQELLERFVTHRDEDAFRTLVESHGRMVLSVCRGVLSDPHDVEDAFQKTFLVLVKDANRIRRRDFIGPWLHRVALRVSLQARTAASVRRARERHASRSEIEIEDDRHEIVSGQVLYEELNRLPDRYRLPLVHCYLEGQTNEEAASRLRCPVGTVKGRLSRAREKLRDRLSRRGVGHATRSWSAPGSEAPCTS